MSGRAVKDLAGLRDDIATEAMAAIIAKHPPVVEHIVDLQERAKLTARGAYVYADAMLDARAAKR